MVADPHIQGHKYARTWVYVWRRSEARVLGPFRLYAQAQVRMYLCMCMCMCMWPAMSLQSLGDNGRTLGTNRNSSQRQVQAYLRWRVFVARAERSTQLAGSGHDVARYEG